MTPIYGANTTQEAHVFATNEDEKLTEHPVIELVHKSEDKIHCVLDESHV